MKTDKTHWKKQFNYDYLGSYSLTPGQDLILTIDKTGKEMVSGMNGTKEELFVVHFKEDVKPMIMNRTNCKTIEKLYTPFIEEWPGIQIQVYAEKVKAFGEETEALRIRAEKPNQKKPELIPGAPKWTEAVEYLKKGGKLAGIVKNWELTEANKEQLLLESI